MNHPTPAAKLVRTRSGILIGAAYTPPPKRMSEDAEAVQALLLEKRRRETCCERNRIECGQGRSCPERKPMEPDSRLFVAICILCGLAGLALAAWR